MHWFVIYTYPNFEKKVYKILLKNNIDSFLPLHKVVRQWSDRKKLVEVPLFPNYIFVNLRKHEKYKIMGIRGVVRFVSVEGHPVEVSDHEINAIKKINEWKEVVAEEELHAGDMVRILEGPFVGLNGIFFERKGKSRLGLTLKSLNKVISIEIHSSLVGKIENNLIIR